MSGGGRSQQLSREAATKFKEGISLVLSKWWVLQLAINDELGDPDSRFTSEQLGDKIFSLFTRSSREPLLIYDLEDWLDGIMISIEVVTDDGSIEQVSEKLMTIHEQCLVGDYSFLENLRGINPQTAAAVPHVTQVAEDDVRDNDSIGDHHSSNMMVDASDSFFNREEVGMLTDKSTVGAASDSFSNRDEAGMTTDEPTVVAEDGFILVACKHKGRRRN